MFCNEIQFITKACQYAKLLCKDTKSEWSGKIYFGIPEAKIEHLDVCCSGNLNSILCPPKYHTSYI